MQPLAIQRRNALAAIGGTLLAPAVGSALLLPLPGRSQDRPDEPQRALDVPYVPTPMPVVQKMLEMAAVRRGDMLYDLGCGDGRIVVTAAKERGARGVGIDLNPVRIEEARAGAQKAGVTSRTKFMVGDLFEADFAEADVVTLYLLPAVNLRLRPQLWRQLKVGTRIVSHSFNMGDWEPERTEQVSGATIYRWTITDKQKSAV